MWTISAASWRARYVDARRAFEFRVIALPSWHRASGAATAQWVICAVACMLFAITTGWFVFGAGFDVLQNSDTSVAGLLADEILRKHSFLPNTWYFGNGEIWTLSTQIFALPFIASMGVSPLALKLANLLVLAVVLGLFTLPIYHVTRSLPFSIAVALGVLACYSILQAQLVYVQPAYAWFCAQFAVLVYLALRMQEDRDKRAPQSPRRVGWAATLYVLVLLNLAVDSPLRVAVYWLAPIVVACIVFPVSRRRAPTLLAVSVLATGAGAILHLVLAKHLLINPGATTSLLQPIERWIPTLSILLKGLLAVTGYAPAWSLMPVSSAGAIRTGFFLIAAIAVWFVPPRGAVSIECRFFARLAGLMLLIVLGVLMVGRLAYDPQAIRYLIPPAFLCVAALMASFWCRFAVNEKATTAIAAIFILTFCGGGVMYVRLVNAASSTECGGPAPVCKLQTTLLRNGLHAGYASYWNANITTLTSSKQVRVCGILLRPRLAPFRWLVSKDCFDPPQEERYFIALAREERQQVDRASLVADAGAPESVIAEGDYEIWVYRTAAANLSWLSR
jgi:hypothetical protein